MQSRFLTVFFLSFSSFVFSQTAEPFSIVNATGVYGFDHYTSEEGLLGNTIEYLYQDSKGYVWVCTRSGLNRLDGKSIVTYSEDNGLCFNQTHSILEASDGIFWIATDRGLSRFDGKNFTNYSTEDGLSSHQVWCATEHKNGGILLGTTDGIDILKDGKISSFMEFDTAYGTKNMIRSLNYDSKGNLWVGSQTTLFKVSGDSIETVANGYVFVAWAEDEDGTIWIGSWSGSLGFYKNGIYDAVPIHSPGINGIDMDADGNLWLATWDKGVVKYDRKNKAVVYGDKQGVGINTVWPLMVDAEDNVWCGTYGSGVAVLIDEKIAHFSENNGLANNIVNDVTEDSLHNFWVATEGGVTCLRPDGTSFHFTREHGLLNLSVKDILIDQKGHIWFALYGDGYTFEYDGTKLISHQVGSGFSISQSSTGEFWLGTDGGGAIRFTNEKDGKSFRSVNGWERVITTFEDSKKRMWLGMDRYAWHVVENDSIHSKLFSPYHNKESGMPICEDSKGFIWITLSGKGLYRCSFEDGKMALHDSIQVSDGLLTPEIGGLFTEGDYIWISSAKGLTRFNLSEYDKSGKVELKHYTRQNGIIGEPTGKLFRTSDGRMLICTTKGLLVLDEKSEKINSTAPFTVITEIKLFQEYIDWGERGIDLKPDQVFPEHINLPYYENYLSFAFNGISFNRHDLVTYQYMLEGFDDNWSPASNRDEIVYSNIPPGEYIFKVKSANKDGIWDETPAEIKITITPPYWQTAWFRILVVLIIIVGLYAFYRWRNHKLIRDKKRLEEQVVLRTVQLDSAFQEIRQKNEEITDSISYAKRIQKAILPPSKLVDKMLGENFIFYKPKDIVAGDFYWINEKNGITLAAVADCTGHGVPGAMVSVVCNAALNRAIREFNLTTPAEILNTVREIVIETFSKSEEEVKDGMDIALISLRKENDKTILEFAGANNPLWIVRKGKISIPLSELHSVHYFEDSDHSLIELKPDKQPVGKFVNEKSFTNQSFAIQKNDVVYLFSDGFADQFGGQKGKKMKNVIFKNILLENIERPLTDQKKILTSAFESWRGDFEQLDDVCVMGIKL